MAATDDRIRAIMKMKNADWAAQQKKEGAMIPILMGPDELVRAYMDRETILFDGELVTVETVTHDMTAEHWRVHTFTMSNGRQVIFRNENLEEEIQRGRKA